MTKRNLLLTLSACLICSALTAFLLLNCFEQEQFRLLERFCESITEQQPESTQAILTALKENSICTETGQETASAAGLLFSNGYRPSDFSMGSQKPVLWGVCFSFFIGSSFFLSALLILRRKERVRFETLTSYLEKVNAGEAGLLSSVPPSSSYEEAHLQDEIYKTIAALQQTRDQALKDRQNYAENLANIAHQLKTPLTAISLAVQRMEQAAAPGPKPDHSENIPYLAQIHKQLARLRHLEEALLLLSRIDSGTLTLSPVSVDVFTLLSLAADNLQELFDQAKVRIDIPELGAVSILADPDWTMEAIMNLMKNCMEHTPPGSVVHCSYETNPLYTRICIRDEGCGFDRQELPHIFERFYRGQTAKNSHNSGIGIGLPLARSIIEMQGGVLTASNSPAPNSGACFEIRMYSH